MLESLSFAKGLIVIFSFLLGFGVNHYFIKNTPKSLENQTESTISEYSIVWYTPSENMQAHTELWLEMNEQGFPSEISNLYTNYLYSEPFLVHSESETMYNVEQIKELFTPLSDTLSLEQ